MWEAFEVRMRKLVRFGPVLESLLCLLSGWPSEQREREGEALRRRAEAAEPHTRHGQHEEREPGSKSEAVAARDGADQPRWRSEGEDEWEEEADLFYFVLLFFILNVKCLRPPLQGRCQALGRQLQEAQEKLAAEKEESRNIRRRGDFLERELHDIREQLEKQVSAHEEAQRMKSKYEVKSESRSYIYYVDKFVLRPLLLYWLLSFWGFFMLQDGLILYFRQ